MIKSKSMIWAGHVVCMRELRNAYKILVVKPEGKASLRRNRCKCGGGYVLGLCGSVYR
jgi:hypothetical protein